MTLSTILILGVFPFAMAYAAASDLVTMTISNRLCLLLVVAFAICAALVGLNWDLIAWHMASGMLVLTVCFGMFAAGWIGGGDAKFAAATALWFGFGQLMPYLMVAAVLGGVLTLAILNLRAMPLPAFAHNWSWAQRLHSPKEGVPYGIALAFAALFVLPETAMWHAALAI